MWSIKLKYSYMDEIDSYTDDVEIYEATVVSKTRNEVYNKLISKYLCVMFMNVIEANLYFDGKFIEKVV